MAPSHYLNQCWHIFIKTPGSYLNEIIFRIWIFSFKIMHLKISSGKWRLFGLGLNVLQILNALHQISVQSNIHNVLFWNTDLRRGPCWSVGHIVQRTGILNMYHCSHTQQRPQYSWHSKFRDISLDLIGHFKWHQLVTKRYSIIMIASWTWQKVVLLLLSFSIVPADGLASISHGTSADAVIPMFVWNVYNALLTRKKLFLEASKYWYLLYLSSGSCGTL